MTVATEQTHPYAFPSQAPDLSEEAPGGVGPQTLWSSCVLSRFLTDRILEHNQVSVILYY